MKKIIALFLCSLLMVKASAQTNTSSFKILNQEETSSFFTPTFKKKNLMNFPIFRAYTYSDKSGNYYVALTESADTINKEKDTVNYNIKAFNFKTDKGSSTKKWEINDLKVPNVKGKEKESSIWFWTKYCSFNDLDDDGLIDPVIVYGTFGQEGYSDGRAKIILFYKGQKVAIRHQNSITDVERKTQIDAVFYTLPLKIQAHIKEIMVQMSAKHHSLFAAGYLEKMDNKALLIGN